MKTTSQSRPLVVYALAACLLFLSLGGFAGASSFISDPSGAGMGMTIEPLRPLLLNDYLLPGTFLLIVFAFGSLVVLYGTWTRATWAWHTTIALGLILLGWLAGEMLILRLLAPITIVCLIDGVLLLSLAALPSLRRYYAGY